MWFTKLAVSSLCLSMLSCATPVTPTHDLSEQGKARDGGEFQALGCPNTTKPCATTQEQLHAVTSYYNTLFSGDPNSALGNWTALNFIQHAPNVTDGQAAAKKAFSSLGHSKAVLQNIFVGKNASGVDFSYAYFKGITPVGLVAVMESWRFSGDCLIEHWVVLQQASGNFTNPKAFF